MLPNLDHFASLYSNDVLADRERRFKVLFDANVAVQGDDPPRGFWCYQHTSDFGTWEQPSNVARESEDGLARTLARLAEVAPTFTPRWRPQVPGRRRVFKARKR